MSDQAQPPADFHPHHVIPIRTYVRVWAALMVLTGVTVLVSFFHLGHLNAVIAVAIATVKASIVALFFMHLLYDERFNLVVFIGGFLFVIVFFAFTLLDPLTRGSVNRIERGPIRSEMARTPTEAPAPAVGAMLTTQTAPAAPAARR